MKRLVLQTATDEVPDGVSFHSESKTILFKDPVSKKITACANKCRHGGGHFAVNSSCVLKCQFHGWELDVTKMEYVNPSGGLKQTQYECETDGTTLTVYDTSTSIFGTETKAPKSKLTQGELVMTFYSHACMEISFGDKYLVTDPWITGPAFTRGWWLVHSVHPEAIKRIANANYIYISHNHSDHLNIPSLELIKSINPNLRFLVPNFESKSVESLLKRLGFENLIICDFNTKIDLGVESKIMILPDTTGRDDSGFLLSYKGHTILNTVDCAKLNDFDLPSSIDVLLHPFASGASGFPVCWDEMYSDEKIQQIVERNRQLTLVEANKMVNLTNPLLFVPFAGYFTEAHPADAAVKKLNKKNSPEEICHFLQKRNTNLQCWTPQTGQAIDLFDLKIHQRFEVIPQGNYDFDRYLDEIELAAEDNYWQKIENVEKYFFETGFQDNLVLQIMETDLNFKEVVRNFMFDFQERKIVQVRPNRVHQFSRFKIRSSVFRYILKNNLPWEDFSIGFQARFYREPDVYEFAFWTHFQNQPRSSQ